MHCSKYGMGRNFLENRNVYVGKFYVSESHGPSRWDRGDLLLGRCLKTSVSSLVAPPRPRSLCSSTIVPGRYEQISCLFFFLWLFKFFGTIWADFHIKISGYSESHSFCIQCPLPSEREQANRISLSVTFHIGTV